MNSTSGVVSLSTELDREATTSYMLSIDATYEVAYAEPSDATCHELSAANWGTQLPWTKEAGASKELEALHAHNYDCQSIVSPLLDRVPASRAEDAEIVLLRDACNEHCSPAGFSCGRATAAAETCPFMPTLVRTTRILLDEEEQLQRCVADPLDAVGVCVEPRALSCNGGELYQARTVLLDQQRSTRSCAQLQRFARAAHSCEKKTRVDAPLVAEVKEDCARLSCAGGCEPCTFTEVDKVVLAVTEGLVTSGSGELQRAKCDSLAETSRRVATCSTEVVDPSEMLLGRLSAAQAELCPGLLSESDKFTVPTVSKLNDAVDAIRVSTENAENVSEHCSSVVSPFLRAADRCGAISGEVGHKLAI